MDGEQLKQGLDGLSKIDGISDFLGDAIYWVAVLFIILFMGYILTAFNSYFKKKKKGIVKDNDDFLDD